MESLKEILESHPFCAGLEQRYVDAIFGCSSNTRFDAGDLIFREQSRADDCYIIREGEVSLEVTIPEAGRFTIQKIKAGEILGWSWLIPPYKWQFDARAITPVRAIILDGKCIHNKIKQDKSFGEALLHRFLDVILSRLQATRKRLVEIVKEQRKDTT